ncbi:hypothetical protein QVD17_42332 [Tagetes erecta]|uniref:Transport membrane protein n=1 Tax=Tagetes erecta TaxID=13708 RepID=A0AAD8NFB2_TARER|nr:hypothetical protein QVD17_42332 [Tagetes erecta]
MSGRGFLPCYQKGGWVKQTPSLDEHGLSQVEPGCAAGCSDRKEISGAMPILHGSGESLIKERAATRLNDLVGSTDVVAGEPLLLLPRRFTQNRAWMELNKIWRTNRKDEYCGVLTAAVKPLSSFLTLLPIKSILRCPEAGETKEGLIDQLEQIHNLVPSVLNEGIKAGIVELVDSKVGDKQLYPYQAYHLFSRKSFHPGNEWNEEKKRGGKWFTGVCLLKMVIILKVFFSILFHGEVRIRSVRILIGLGLTWFTRYWFPEELISPLAKPFLILTLPLDSYFVRTQSTEASPTYLAASSIACSYFVFPLISHQIWCFLIPSCYGEQRTKYNRFLHLSGSRFSLFLFLTPPRVVPNVWHFPYLMGATSTNSLMIKLQPKIYDHIMLTVRISFIPSVCSQVPVIVIRLPEPRGLSVETSTNNRRFLMVFPLLTAALSTPPDIWCQIVAPFLIFSIIELAISVASIVQVREEGWTSGMRESGSIDKKE